MGRNIVFCADGTWNRPGGDPEVLDAPTNVWRLFNALAGVTIGRTEAGMVKETPEQVAFYVDGVGTTRLAPVNWVQGAVGLGVREKIADGYLHISRHYGDGDRVFLFGFSRGAYVVRSLAGLICQHGLLEASGDELRDQSRAWFAVERFLGGATAVGEFGNRTTAESYDHFAQRFENLGWSTVAGWMRMGQRYFSPASDPVVRRCPVAMIGVWDTVGSLGVPVGLFDVASESLFEFKNLKLSTNVTCGCHAIAIDELREAFQPTLWEPRDGVEQVWFCGSHADVGGGYAKAGLSDYALRWMMARARGQGVLFGAAASYTPDLLQEPTDSYLPLFGKRLARVLPEGAALHESVVEKLRRVPAYRPAALRLAAGADPAAAYRIVGDA